jgi:type IV secretory pathway TraG/TraD family ATPase VirD4
LWDYRGVARPQDIASAPLDLPLGRLIDPKAWRAERAFGLPAGVANQHTCVLGPTRSGKTASIVAPWIHAALRQGQSVLAVDVKGRDDLLGEVKRHSAQVGVLGVPVIKWDYNDPARSASWNWIAQLDGDSQINAAVEAVCGRVSPSDPNKFFHQSAIKYLRGLLLLAPAVPGGLDLGRILRLLDDQTALESLVTGHRSHPGAQRLIELTGLSRGEFIKHTMELRTHLETLDTQGFLSVTQRDQFSFDVLHAERPVLVIVSAPVADGALGDAASSLFLGQFLQRALTGFGPVGRPVLLVLDEAARVQNRIDLGSTLSLVAGVGVSSLLATQDVSQFQAERRDEIMANCGNLICLPRVSKASTDFLAGRLGEMAFPTVSSSASASWGPMGQSWTRSEQRGPVLGHREIASPHPALGPWPGVVHCPALSSRPILVDLTRPDLAR